MFNNLSMELKMAKNLVTIVRNSVESNTYRNLFAQINGEEKDILEDGRLSCAYFVSSILYNFQLIRSVHATVSGTVRDLADSGWVEIHELRDGAVIEWQEIDYGTEGKHKHLGFFAFGKAISNDFEEKKIIQHEVNFRNREIGKIWWHHNLNN